MRVYEAIKGLDAFAVQAALARMRPG